MPSPADTSDMLPAPQPGAHSRILALKPGAAQCYFWPMKMPGDVLPYGVDAAAFLTDGALVLQRVDLFATSGLQILSSSLFALAGNTATPGGVLLDIGGGEPGAVEAVMLRLLFEAGGELHVNVALAIGPADPPGLLPVGSASLSEPLLVAGQPLTVAGQPLLV